MSEGQTGVCGRCEAKATSQLLSASYAGLYLAWPRILDMGEDFHGWGMEELSERVKLVQEFDQLCDDSVVDEYISRLSQLSYHGRRNLCT